MSAKRFGELLQAAAKVSFVRPDELKSLCVSGITNIFDSILKERTLTSGEVWRITELIDELGAGFREGLGLDEKLLKVSIVSGLYDKIIPDPVSVVGPMPIEFGRGEAILWIFNDVTSYRMPVDPDAKSVPIEMHSPVDNRYFSPKLLGETHVPKKKLSDEAKGDLILTNRNIYFLQSESSQTRIAISRIVSMQAYAEGLYVGWKPSEGRSRTFLLNDSWFAANVIARLIQLAHR
jgi:hypothetical protein